MTATKIVKCLLIAALLACATAKAAEQTIVIASLDEGNEITSFKVGDLDCVVKASQIRCTK
jgi:hypothetical protein